MTGRELAWRVLAHELRASSEEEKGSGEKSPSYVLSPLGARMNRVLMSGEIAVPEPLGAGPNAGFMRAPLTDPTGTVTVTAGAFQPHAQAELQRISSPTSVLVVGKATLFRGTEGSPVASIRAETVRPIADTECRTLTAEAATQSLERLELVLRLRGAHAPTDDDLRGAGVPPAWIRGARASLLRYSSIDPTLYYASLRAVLIAVQGSSRTAALMEPRAGLAASNAGVVRVVHPRAAAATLAPSAGLQALEGRLLEILDDLADESPDGYADMDDLSERAARHGLDGERMEELLNYLSENGTIEEPLVGKFRRADGPPRD
ncbi:MAG: hypothetical protein L3K14_08350 [Thermoplasmata archaeon]|nr:hypothetical protein [Thermoplasmata archaeon]